jgi:hypothetical protein
MEDFTLKNRKIIITGKTRSGKSELLRYLIMNDPTKFHDIFVICPTEKINHFYEGLVRQENIFEEFEDDWLKKLIQKLTDKNGGKKLDKDKKDVLLIMDDCGSDADFIHSKSLKVAFTRGRHVNLSIIVTCQYIYNVPPVVRANVDYCFFGQMNHQSVELLCAEYLLGQIDKKKFIEMYHRCTSNFSFLVKVTAISNQDIDKKYLEKWFPKKIREIQCKFSSNTPPIDFKLGGIIGIDVI